jgi:hypothetical protein
MAGNVKEWCWNEDWEGRKLIMGGGFGEPNYLFHQPDAQLPWERLPGGAPLFAEYETTLTSLTQPNIPRADQHRPQESLPRSLIIAPS